MTETNPAPEAKTAPKRFIPSFATPARVQPAKLSRVESAFVGHLSTSQARPFQGSPSNQVEVYLYPEAIRLQDDTIQRFPEAFWSELDALKTKYAQELGGVVVGGARSGVSGTRITHNRRNMQDGRSQLLNAGFMAGLTRMFNEATGSKLPVPMIPTRGAVQLDETEAEAPTTIPDGEVPF